ncbi:hypothetical protein EYF80_011020 [Liparis tanakae]|uniref:Uncharacterized protein n=1 Tax=Liparis tanakae TaxID=230148 RepID=A0A4Z2ILC3_9TELE|nr:hypothetical protein EYF80_011020 [Liparis tanakae]
MELLLGLLRVELKWSTGRREENVPTPRRRHVTEENVPTLRRRHVTEENVPTPRRRHVTEENGGVEAVAASHAAAASASADAGAAASAAATPSHRPITNGPLEAPRGPPVHGPPVSGGTPLSGGAPLSRADLGSVALALRLAVHSHSPNGGT